MIEIEEQKEFEKMFSIFKSGTMAIANDPDDWTKCSIVLSTKNGYANIHIDEIELDQVIGALQQVKADME